MIYNYPNKWLQQPDVPSAPPLNTSQHKSNHEFKDIPSVGGVGFSGYNGSHVNEISVHATAPTKPVDQNKVRYHFISKTDWFMVYNEV